MALPSIKFRTYQALSSLTSPGEVMVDLVDAGLPIALDPPPKAIYCLVAGTFVGEDLDGNTITDFPVVAGFNPIRPSRIDTISPSLDVDGGIWAVW